MVERAYLERWFVADRVPPEKITSRTFVDDDESVQPKPNETAPRSECRLTFKNALTQPRLLEMAEYVWSAVRLQGKS